MPKAFFDCTEDAFESVSDLFNFIWPTAAAMWNLRWQVRGFLSEASSPTSSQLSQRFVSGSGIAGADLKHACVDRTWDEQQDRLAAIVLMNAFAIYEHWADRILESLGEGPDQGVRLQRPDGQQPGVGATVATLCVSESAVLKSAFYPIFTQEKRYSITELLNLTLAYRYFKEIRNSLAHRGGLASPRAEAAYIAFAPVSDRAHLKMKGALIHHSVTAGAPVRISLRGVVGFCDILLRMMATIDAELCKSSKAEPYFRDRLSAPSSLQPSTLSSDLKRRRQQVAKRCVVCGFPSPKDPDAVYGFLRHHALIRL